MIRGTADSEKRALHAEELPAFQGFKLLHLKTQIQELLTQFGRNGLFEEYTKHDVTHLNEMLKIYDWLLPDDTKQTMSPADWLLLVCSTYFHDLGLIITRNEFANRMSSGFSEFRESALQAADTESRDYKAYLDTLTEDAKERFLYQEFVRTYHAARIRSWLQERPDPLLGYDPQLGKELKALLVGLEPVFIADLGIVCESHHLDDLHDTQRYPISRPYGNSGEETANVQFAAIALRAADLLHITRDRTPSIAFRIINPTNPDSQAEWAKQASVRAVRPRLGLNSEGNLAPDAPRDTIEVHAEFTDAEGFFGLNSYITYSEKQLRQCNAWATHSHQQLATGKRFPWRHIDAANIKAQGFIARQFQFTLDQTNILELLTGHTLYNDSGVVVRELVQNALDSVRLQTFTGKCTCPPRVNVHWSSSSQTLEVTDNGTGMTQDIIEQNFLRVGASRYQESSFKREFPGFSAISRFGIGVLSTFMISDEVEVVTCSSEDESAREISLRSVHGQYLIRLFSKEDERISSLIREHGHGTTVRIRIRHSAEISDILSVLKRWIVLPKAEVLYSEDEGATTVVGFTDLANALTDVVKDIREVESISGTLRTVLGDKIEIRTAESDGVQVAYAVSWSPFFQEWSFLTARELQSDRQSAKKETIDNRLGITVQGIRVEPGCPGFKNGSVLAIADVSGSRAPRTNVARTALERTTEFNVFLMGLYRAYCEHLRTEVSEITSDRGSSASKAANQLQFLIAPIDIGFSNQTPVNPQLLVKAFHEVPAFLTESVGVRRLLSIGELEKLGEFITVDSFLIRRVENLLAALPGAVTLEDVARLADGGQMPPWDAELPMVCGVRWGTINRLLYEAWEPKSIDVDEKGSVSAKWTRSNIEQSKRCWWPSTETDDDSSIMGLYRVIASLRRSSRSRARTSAQTFFPLSDVPVNGLDQFDSVIINGCEYVLPHSSLLKMDIGQFSDFRDRLAIISVTRGLFEDQNPREGDAVREYLKEQLLVLNLGGSVSVDGLWTMGNYRLNIFDVSRWDRSYKENNINHIDDFI